MEAFSISAGHYCTPAQSCDPHWTINATATKCASIEEAQRAFREMYALASLPKAAKEMKDLSVQADDLLAWQQSDSLTGETRIDFRIRNVLGQLQIMYGNEAIPQKGVEAMCKAFIDEIRKPDTNSPSQPTPMPTVSAQLLYGNSFATSGRVRVALSKTPQLAKELTDPITKTTLKAKGVFWALYVRMEATPYAASIMDAQLFMSKVRDASGSTSAFSPASAATMAAAASSKIADVGLPMYWGGIVVPGEPIEGVIVFDLPSDKGPYYLTVGSDTDHRIELRSDMNVEAPPPLPAP